MELYQGDCLEVMKTLKDNSVDAIVTDPPYGLKFMSKKWDYEVPTVEIWTEALRVLKPGGHLLSFGGTRTYHRMVVNIEDAGFEIRDQIQWLYGSGFPKSHNISKGIDKKLKAKREKIKASGGLHNNKNLNDDNWKKIGNENAVMDSNKPSTDLAKKWDGYGTALKPANEPIVLARKPLSEKTVAANVIKWGTGGINIDGCRIEFKNEKDAKEGRSERPSKTSNKNSYSLNHGGLEGLDRSDRSNIQGRFPANLLLDEAAAEMLDEQSGISASRVCKDIRPKQNNSNASINFNGKAIAKPNVNTHADKGGASRFFYCAKASKSERSLGNNHPTVKPIKLMQYLTKLITPPNGIVLDPFMGSGTTGVACKKLNRKFIGIERDKDYFKIAKKRITLTWKE